MSDDDAAARSGWVVVAGAVVLAVVGLLVVPSLVDDATVDPSGAGADTTAATTVAPTTPATTVPELSGACGEAHAGHNLAMWDPTAADEMLDAGCPWPYPPFDDVGEGGTENPNLGATFEARRYSELWDMLQEARIGLCSVGPLVDAPGDGFTFGFRYTVRRGGCVETTDTVDLVVREYATRAWRDAQAAALAADGVTLVLGRWAVQVVGADEFTVNRLYEGLVELGAVTVAARA
jgi:hypothetical protein